MQERKISPLSPRQKLLYLAEFTVRIVDVLITPGVFDGLFLFVRQMPRQRRVVIRVFKSGQINLNAATGALPPAFLQQVELDVAVRKLSGSADIIERDDRHARLEK